MSSQIPILNRLPDLVGRERLYDKLATDPQEIRLLNVDSDQKQPGSLHLTLRTEKFELARGTYKALSYWWGHSWSPTHRDVIFVTKSVDHHEEC